ncbi:hypothetical protein AURDEDRAFT_114643 [Auricularia subglabra TFB-10046 SS5]|nr:hypothetical protein AURDEDRAFT_114643 [Auricularia subglabra TFB-10046 SS5]
MLLFLLSLLLLRPHSTCTAQSTNLTIDDSDPQVLYMPVSSWRASSVSCSSCFNPVSDDIRQGTFHDGTGGLNDRMRGSDSGPGGEDEHNGPDNDQDSLADLTAMPGVSATFSFTGTAVFVYCIVPNGADGDHITNSDLSFTVDGKPAGQFKRTPTQEPVTFLYNQLVFSQRDLPAAKHEVVISSPANGALLLDYVQFTQSDAEDAPADPTDGPHPTPKAADANMKHRNSVSFAVAVGATVGTLSIVTMTVCVSLFYRRRRSARRLERERRDAERAHPSMDGPAPFVPRFFPRGQNDEDGSSQQTAAVSVATSSTATNDSYVPRFFPRSQPSQTQTAVAQAAPAFVPRYFPGGPRPIPPASPPPPPTPPALTPSGELPPLPYAPQLSQRPPIQQRASPATPLLSNPTSSAPASAIALPALSEADAVVLDLPPPPDSPPPFDAVRLPSYETALIDSGPQDRSSSSSHNHSAPRTPS